MSQELNTDFFFHKNKDSKVSYSSARAFVEIPASELSQPRARDARSDEVGGQQIAHEVNLLVHQLCACSGFRGVVKVRTEGAHKDAVSLSVESVSESSLGTSSGTWAASFGCRRKEVSAMESGRDLRFRIREKKSLDGLSVAQGNGNDEQRDTNQNYHSYGNITS